MAIVSTSTPGNTNEPPYTVTQQRHDVAFRPDGTQGGEYTVHIRHKNGTRTQFKVPEENYTAQNVHAMAMQQVSAVQQVDQLPHSVAGQKSDGTL